MSNFSLNQLMINDIEKAIQELEMVLESSGIKLNDRTLFSAIEAIKRLNIIKEGKNYVGLVFDKSGYIIGGYDINNFIDKSKIPRNISRGFYKLVGGEIVLDEKRRKHLTEV
jgi:hypothetical protein